MKSGRDMLSSGLNAGDRVLFRRRPDATDLAILTASSAASSPSAPPPSSERFGRQAILDRPTENYLRQSDDR